MGFWSGIKHALNSTLGTSEFKPLNEIVIGSKALIASDTYYATVFEDITAEVNPTLNLAYDESVEILQMEWSGSFNIYVTARSTTYTEGVSIEVNGITANTVELPSANDYYTVALGPISFNKGDIISVRNYGGVGRTKISIQSIKIYADVSDVSAFTILDIEE